jgi:hypothetical protein
MDQLRAVWRRLGRRHDAVKCFDAELRAAGRLLGRADAGLRAVAVDQIVGSVGRWRSLRADFLDRDGPALTERHRRIAAAMAADRPLPALELYRLSVRRPDDGDRPARDEYYVVDGHHRVAMARRLGRAYLDAHVVEYRVAPGGDGPGAGVRRGARRRPDGGRPSTRTRDRSPMHMTGRR